MSLFSLETFECIIEISLIDAKIYVLEQNNSIVWFEGYKSYGVDVDVRSNGSFKKRVNRSMPIRECDFRVI